MPRSLVINSTPALDGTGKLEVTYTQNGDKKHYIHLIGVALVDAAANATQRAIKITTVGPVRKGTRTVEKMATEITQLDQMSAIFALVNESSKVAGDWESLHTTVSGASNDAFGKTIAFAPREIMSLNQQRARNAARAITTNMQSESFTRREPRVEMLRTTLTNNGLPASMLSDAQVDILDSGIMQILPPMMSHRQMARGVGDSSDSTACDLCQVGLWIVAVFVGIGIIIITVGAALLISESLILAVKAIAGAAGLSLTNVTAARIVTAATVSPGLAVTAILGAVIKEICKQAGDCT